MATLCTKLSTDKVISAAYHPQAHGLVERLFGTIQDRLAFLSSADATDWFNFLSSALFAIRTTPKSSIGMSLFEALYGHRPIIPVEITLLPPPTITKTSSSQISRLHTERLAHLQNDSRTSADRVRCQAAEDVSRHRRCSNYAVGDYVCAFTPTANSSHASFERHWHGPYRLAQKVLTRAEWILDALVQGRPVERTVHKDDIKPYYHAGGRPVKDTPQIPSLRPQPIPEK